MRNEKSELFNESIVEKGGRKQPAIRSATKTVDNKFFNVCLECYHLCSCTDTINF